MSPFTERSAPIRIGELSRRVGVSAELLRAWERRYDLLTPMRTSGGLRLYGEKDERLVARMLGGIRGGFVLTWVAVATGLSATVVLYIGPWRTLTVVMFQALESGGGGVATAAASTLIVVTLLPIALLYRLVRRYELS